MNVQAPSRSLAGFWIMVLVFFSPLFLQGCDSLMSTNDADEISSSSQTTQTSKLRHPGLLDAAMRSAPGKSASSTATDLFLAFNEYEANGITKRVLNKYEVTTRILEEYGITRRVLNQYGITRRVLNQYGITRRVLNQYGITRRVLDKYGITRRLLDKYEDQVTLELLEELGVSEADLTDEGLNVADIDGFVKLTSLLDENGVTIEQFIEELESYLSAIRLKVYIDGAHLGITVSIDSKVLDAILEEMNNDPDILFVEPDIAIDTSDLGMTSGAWYDRQIVPWGITQTATPIPSLLDLFSADYIKTNPVHVFLLDSGATPDSWVTDLYYVEKKDFTMLFENPDQLTWDESMAPDLSGFDPDTLGNPYDESGHGAHIAGTIGAINNLHGVVGVAPGVMIHSLKVLTSQGKTDITTLLAAVDYVTRAKRENPEWPIVVNFSLGVDIGTTSYNILDEAIAASSQEGVIYVAAAGNNGHNADTHSPAHVEDVITVAAHNQEGVFSEFSNYGSVIDIVAPGENIVSLSHLLSETKNAESILASGTSYAAPHVTGAVARYLGSHPNARASEVAEALQAATTPTLTDLPSGTPNRALHVGNLLSTTTQDSEDSDTKKVKDKKGD